jgi:hypothetical protein
VAALQAKHVTQQRFTRVLAFSPGGAVACTRQRGRHGPIEDGPLSFYDTSTNDANFSHYSVCPSAIESDDAFFFYDTNDTKFTHYSFTQLPWEGKRRDLYGLFSYEVSSVHQIACFDVAQIRPGNCHRNQTRNIYDDNITAQTRPDNVSCQHPFRVPPAFHSRDR